MCTQNGLFLFAELFSVSRTLQEYFNIGKLIFAFWCLPKYQEYPESHRGPARNSKTNS